MASGGKLQKRENIIKKEVNVHLWPVIYPMWQDKEFDNIKPEPTIWQGWEYSWKCFYLCMP